MYSSADLLPRTAVERRIALARLVMPFFSLIGWWLDSTEPQQYAQVAGALLGAYVLCALVTAGLAWLSQAPRGSAWLIHAADLLVVSALLATIERPFYLLLPLLVYAFLSGSLRWQWRGTLWTGAILLAVSIAIGLYRATVEPALVAAQGVVVRSAALAVIAILTGRLGALEARTRRQMRQLATPPDLPSASTDNFVGPMLEWAGGITGTPRVLLVWEDPEEPWTELASWDGLAHWRNREQPGALDRVVAADLAQADFLHQPPAPCVVAHPGGFRSWNGEPLDPAFQARFSIGSVFAVRLTGEELSGRLFFLDKRRATSDDLILGSIIGHQLASRLRALHLARRLEETVLIQERLRLARDLHDGIFQSLTGLALEAERLLRTDALQPEVRDSLHRMQLSLKDDQRTLRMLIEGRRTADATAWAGGASLETHLKDLVDRLDQQWGLAVEFCAARLTEVPVERWADVCLIVHEALLNASRHGNASSCRLEVGRDEAGVRLVVADNGRGFPFKGRYDHDALTALSIGPSTLRERTILLGGTISLDSKETGSRLEIRFPVGP